MKDSPGDAQSLYYQRLLEGRQKNYEALDKAVLTLASAGLGVSAGVIQSVVPLRDAEAVCFLILSWFAFCVSIVVHLISFHVGRKAHDVLLLLRDLPEYARGGPTFHKSESLRRKTETLNRISTVCLIVALLATVIFLSVNAARQSERLGHSERKDEGEMHQNKESQPAEKPTWEKRGITPPAEPQPRPSRPAPGGPSKGKSDTKRP